MRFIPAVSVVRIHLQPPRSFPAPDRGPEKTIYGPMVKRLRHRPFTAVTRVRFPFGSPKGGRTQTCHALQKINFRLPVPCRLKSARMSARRGFGKTKISLFVRAKRFCRRVFRAVKREFAARLAPCKNERNAARIKAASETVTRFASCHPMGV